MNKKATADDLADLSEPLIDESTKNLLQTFAGETLPELASDVPIAKTILVIGKLFNSAKDYHQTKMMLAFLSGLADGLKTMEEFDRLEEVNKNHLRGIVVSQLDMQSDELQAEAIGFLVDAYLRKEIDRLTFTGVLSEIKNTNPLLYYFNVDSIIVAGDYSSAQEATGPVDLLPAAFGHNTVTDIGQWDSTGRYKFVLSRLGKAFFKYVYNPMSVKYRI